jgi:hypothetical protein
MVRPSKELVNASGDTIDRIPKRRQDGQVSRLVAQLGNNLLAIVGVVSSIAGFVSLVASKQLRSFVKIYSYPICVSLIIVALALLVTLDYVQTVRRQRNQLQAAADRLRELRPSAHDIRLFTEILAELPLDGPVITWLRQTNAAALGLADVPADVLTALDRTVRRLERRPVGFDDDRVARALADFVSAVGNYRMNLETWTLMLQNVAPANAVDPLLSNDTDPITGVLADSQHQLLQAYDSFIMTAHKRGIDIEP